MPPPQPVPSGSSSVKPTCVPLGFTEGAACGQSLEDRQKTVAEVKRILENTGFPWHVVALEEVGGSAPVKGPVVALEGEYPSGSMDLGLSVPSFIFQGVQLAPISAMLHFPGVSRDRGGLQGCRGPLPAAAAAAAAACAGS